MPFGDYLAADRAAALARRTPLPEVESGSVLVADISGFTPLTATFVRELGPHLGADELTRHINNVYEGLIGTIHRYGGVVVSFAGDAVTCWFRQPSEPESPNAEPVASVAAPAFTSAASAVRALRCGFVLQQSMAALATIRTPGAIELKLALKVAVATGPVRRLLVGDPTIQRIDVLAGSTLLRLAAAEHVAAAGEVVLDVATAELLAAHVSIGAWRQDDSGARRAAVVSALPNGLGADSAAKHVAAQHNDADLSFDDARPLLLLPLAERLAAGYGDPPTELRPVVALLLGFTTLEYDSDLVAGAQLDRYIRWVQAVVVRYGGALIQLTFGDKGSYGYIAFGAPVAHENDAQRALYAALDLQAPPPELAFAGPVRIGLTRGTMRTGSYGGSGRRAYGVLGDAVNVAARLMQAAPAGHTLVEAALQQPCAEQFAWEPLVPVRIKGKPEPVTVFRLIAARQEHAIGFYEGTLVGRDTDVAQVLRAAQPVLDGRFAGVCLVSGEAGVGKSRLVYEARQRLAEHTALTWMYCPSDAVLRGSLRPFASGLSAYFNQALAGDEAENKARFDARVDALISALHYRRQPDAR